MLINFIKNKIPWGRFLIAIILGTFLILSVSYIFALYYKHPIYIHYPSIFSTIVLAYFMIEGIRLINRKIDKYWGWDSNPKRRFWIQLFFDLSFTIVMLSIFGTIISLYIAKDPSVNLYDLIIINSVGTIAISLFVFVELIVFMLRNWKGSLVEIEKYKQRDIEAKFESLKNQLSPHFLFNNLNTLYGLIKDDQELASEFLLKLSDIYRYVLEIKGQELVSLKNELDFVTNYSFLLSIRYGERLEIMISVESELHANKLLPPFTLQLLIENAVKHNVIDEDQKLMIKIFSKDKNSLVVNNNLLSMPNTKESTKVGIRNLKQRYRFFTDQKLEFERSEDQFFAKVPLLDVADVELLKIKL